jgi:hypothetical protein
MPYTTINSGDYITSAWANANVRDQVVTPYSSTSDRSTNGPAIPTNGMASTLSANDSTNGLYIYNGAAWRAPWNLPWGYTPISATPGSLNFNSTIAYTSTFTWTGVNRRYYKVTLTGDLQNSTVTGDNVSVGMYTSTGTLLFAFPTNVFNGTNQRRNAGGSFVFTSTTSGTQTWKIGALSSSSATTQTFGTASLIIEDAGPSGAPA